MKQHYKLSDAEWEKLIESITTMDLLKAIPEFDPHGTGAEISKVSLMLYLDRRGDFSEGKEVHQKIAKAVFNSLDSSDKIAIFEYMEFLEEEENG